MYENKNEVIIALMFVIIAEIAVYCVLVLGNLLFVFIYKLCNYIRKYMHSIIKSSHNNESID